MEVCRVGNSSPLQLPYNSGIICCRGCSLCSFRFKVDVLSSGCRDTVRTCAILELRCAKNWGPQHDPKYWHNRILMGSCQNYAPFLGTLNDGCRIIIGTHKGDHNFDNHPCEEVTASVLEAPGSFIATKQKLTSPKPQGLKNSNFQNKTTS